MNICILFALLFIFACSPGPVPETVQDAQEKPQEPDDSNEKSDESVPESDESVSESDESLSEEVIEHQEKAATVKNYEFSYSELSDNRITRKYYVRDSLVRIEPYMGSTRERGSYDVIYLDIANRETAGYCELGSESICLNPEEKIADPDFDEYYFALPHELLQDLESGEVVSGLTYEDFPVDVIDGKLNADSVRLYVHNFYGIPLYIEYGPSDGLAFRDISFNSVTEEQVTPPRW